MADLEHPLTYSVALPVYAYFNVVSPVCNESTAEWIIYWNGYHRSITVTEFFALLVRIYGSVTSETTAEMILCLQAQGWDV